MINKYDEEIESNVDMERRLIAERTKNALRARKEQGVKLGRPAGKGRKVEKILREKNVDIDGLKNIGLSAVKIGKLIGVDRRTVSDYLIEQEKKNQEARKLKIDTVITDRVKTACNMHLRNLLSDALSEPDGKKRVLNIKIELCSGEPDKVATKVSIKAKLPEADASEVPGILDFT